MNADPQRIGMGSGEGEVLRIADTWAAAELRGDTSVLGAALADNFIGIGPRGFMLTKEEWLARHRSGDLKYESFELTDAKVRVYRDAAILTAREVAKTTYRGQAVPGQFRVTLAFVKEAGRWLLAGLQLSPIADGA